jgi:alpha-tubulin suppressor-like RCC1 family protein
MGKGYFKHLIDATFNQKVTLTSALLLQSCIAPNANLSFVPTQNFDGGNSGLNQIMWSGPASIGQNTCMPYSVATQASNGSSLTASESINISVGSSSGIFFQDSGCTMSAAIFTLPAGAHSTTIYFKSSVASNVILQAWAQFYQGSSYPVNVVSIVGAASKAVFTTEPSASATSGTTLSQMPVVQAQDANGNLVNSFSGSVTLSAYTDSTCTTSAGVTLNSTSMTTSAGIAAFSGLQITTSSAATIYLKAFSSSLSSACSSAITVSIGTSMVAVAAGESSACVLSSVGNVFCWGDNTYGELGNATLTTSGTPTEVRAVGGAGFLSGVTAISGNGSEFCAVSGGNVFCWGDNSNGQLGDNSVVSSPTPVMVLGSAGTGTLSGILSVSVGYQEACAVSTAGNAYCWGAGTSGQLGNGSTSSDNHYPVEVVGLGGSGVLGSVTSIGVGMSGACAVANANVYCWGLSSLGALGNNNATGTTGIPVEVLGVGATGVLSSVTSVTVNAYSACAVSLGAIYCWGNNGNGQLGNDSTTLSPVPVAASGMTSGATSVSIGQSSSTCAVVSGAAFCWGSNSFGGLGNNSTTQSLVPVSVSDLNSGVTQISTGSGFACAVVSGHAYCWGANTVGETGQGTTGGQNLIPVEVVGF